MGSTLAPISGSFTVTIPAGQDSVTFGLVDTSTSQQSQTAQVSATLNSDQAVSNNLTVTFAGAPEPSTTNSVIEGKYDSSSGYTKYSGDGQNDLISAGSGQNSIDGGNGNDSITSSSGDDIINVGNGNSTIAGGGGKDLIYAQSGNNQIFAGNQETLAAALSQLAGASVDKNQSDAIAVLDGNNTIVGGNGNQLVLAGTGNNVVVLGAGTNTFDGGVETGVIYTGWSVSPLNAQGISTISGAAFVTAPFTAPDGYEGATTIINGETVPLGTGNDTIYGGTGQTNYFLPNGKNYVDAGGGNDFIQASTGSSTIWGGDGNDTINGGGGNDYINTEGGSDKVEGQGGNTTIVGGSGNDSIWAGDGNDSWATSINTENTLIELGSGDNHAQGAGGNDTIIGGTGNDTILGGSGNESLVGGFGNTSILGGDSNDGMDTIVAGSGNDSINVGSADTTVTGGSGVDIIWGGSGNDVISTGDGGTDTSTTQVTAGSGNTTITGGAGVDAIWGGSGNDVIYAGDGGDTVQATQITAGSGNDTIYAGGGKDNIIGGIGATTVYGGSGTETVSVGQGNMSLYSGSGINVFTSGKGSATYEIDDNGGATTIVGASGGDTLQFGPGVSMSDVNAVPAVDANGNPAILLTLDDGTSVAIDGGTLSEVTFDDGTVTFAQLLSAEFTQNGITYVTGNQPTTGNSVVGVQQLSKAGLPTGSLTSVKQAGTPAPTKVVLMGTADLSFTGDSGSDIIHANGGNDTLIAGTGSDTLIGGGASDTYVAAGVSGTTTTIQGSSGNDTLVFGTGITAANLSVTTTTAQDGSLVVTLQSAQGSTVVIDAPSSASILDQLQFADGSTASLGQLIARLSSGADASTSGANVTLAGGIQNLSLTGSSNLTATANGQDDVITANSGNDTLFAGAGQDTLVGSAGHTTYDLSQTDGNVVINNSNAGDVLVFDSSVQENNLTTTSTVVNGQTIVTITDVGGGSITINGGNLSQVSFADGNTATIAQLLSAGYTNGSTTYSQVSATAASGITGLVMTGNGNVSATANSGNDTLVSNVGNDTLNAGTGNDTLVGGGVSDTYVIANGSQTTTIQNSSMFDALVYGTGITAANLSAIETTVPGGASVITVTNSAGGSVVIDVGAGAPVDTIEFANGSTASIGALLAQNSGGTTVATSAASVTLPGGIQNMTLTGTASITATGNELSDVISANTGNDTLFAGAGNDTLVGSTGATTYDVAPLTGSVTITNSSSKDLLVFGAGITESDLTTTSATVNGQTVVTIADDQGGTITIQGGGLSQLSFADGSTATLAQLLATSYSTSTTLYSQTSVVQPEGTPTVVLTGSANITATGNDQAGTLQANAGNDTLISGTGNDTMIGGGTSTTYEVSQGSGSVTIQNSGTNDTILVTASGVSASNAFATAKTATDGSTTVTLTDYSGTNVVIQDYGNGTVDTVKYADGSTASLAELVAQSNDGSTASSSAVNVTLPGGIQNETLIGTANLRATGNNLPDVIDGNSGNDTLIAGSANDTLISGGGTNTYEVAASSSGVGNVVIKNALGSDTLIFEDGATAANLSAANETVNGYAVTVITDSLDGETVTLWDSTALNNISLLSGGTLTISQLLAPSYISGTTEYAQGNATAPAGVTTLQLTGTGNITGTANSANDVIVSNAGNDTLVAGTGADTLVGGTGATTYSIGTTSGAATIVYSNGGDTISFGAGVTLANLTATAALDGSGNITIGDSAGHSITIDGTGGSTVDKLVFADGSTASLNYLLAQATTGPTAQSSSTNVVMQGNIRNLTLTGNGNLTAIANNLPDLITANSGNDTLNAGAANDTLVAGAGNDVLNGNGGTSATTYAFNYQSGDTAARTVTIADSGANDVLQFGAGIAPANVNTVTSTVNGVTTTTFSLGQYGTVVATGGLNTVEFANGLIVTPAALISTNGIVGNTEYSSTSATLSGGLANLVLTGTGNITGTAGTGNVTITGNVGNDTLYAGSGTDTLNGGPGNDLLVSTMGSTVMNSGNPTGASTGVTTYDIGLYCFSIINAGPKDILQLGSNVNIAGLSITQNGNQWKISETNFNVTVNGTPAYVEFPDGSLLPFASFASGNYTVGTSQTASVSTTMGAGITSLTLTAQGITGTGNSLNDIITGTTGDTLNAGTGFDTLVGGSANETLNGGAAPTTYQINESSLLDVYGSVQGPALTIGSSSRNDSIAVNMNAVAPGPGSNQTDASVFTSEPSNISAVTVPGGLTEVTIGYLSLIVGANGMANTLLFPDGSTASLDQMLLSASGWNISSSTGGAMPTASIEMTLTGSANLSATGNALDDIITANSGNDSLTAGTGTDTLNAGSGSDTIVAGSGPDMIVPGTGTVTVQKSTYLDVVDFASSHLSNLTAKSVTTNGVTVVTLTSSSQSGTVVISGGQAVVATLDGNFTLAQVLGVAPTTTTSSTGGAVSAGVTNFSLTGSANLMAIGNNLNDVITGNSGNDTLVAGPSTQSVDGTPVGHNTLIGGTGNDTFVINSSTDVIQEAANTGNNTEQTSISATLAANVQNLTGTGYGAITLTGNNLANVITGNSGNDTLTAGSGIATLIGGAHSEFVINNAGDVIQASGTGNTEISSASTVAAANIQTLVAQSSYSLQGNGNWMAYYPVGGAVSLTGNNLNDSIYGNGNMDTLVAGSGNDTIYSPGSGTATTANYNNRGSGDVMVGSNGGHTVYSINAAIGNFLLNANNNVQWGGYVATIQNSQSSDELVFNNVTNGIDATSVQVNGVTDIYLSAIGNGTVVEVQGGNLSTVMVNGAPTTIAQLLAQTTTATSGANVTLPGGTNVMTLTGNANISATGNDGDDVIIANSGKDTLIGGTGTYGSTTLIGGSGDDTFVQGGNYQDVIVKAPNNGNNTEESAYTAILAANVQNLVGTGGQAITLSGNSQNATISANSGNDTLVAGSANTTLIGGSGGGYMDGNAGTGVTTYVVNTGDGNITIGNTGSNDVLDFGAGITASGIFASSTGSGSATVVTLTLASGGTVTLNAPSFTQVAFAGGGTTTLAALLAQVNTSITSSSSIVMPAGTTQLTLIGTADISGTGNNLADTIIANPGNDTLIAGTGLATLVGGTGTDTFEVNSIADVIQQATANAGDVVQSTADYILPANLSILTGTLGGNIKLTGNTLADTITANSGNDTLVSGTIGVDTLIGGSGTDTFVINNSNDKISVSTAKAGNVVQASVNYVLPTNLLYLSAPGSVSVSLTGNSGNDTLVAGTGSDTLIAGTGSTKTTMTGGAGSDTFVINNTGDIITAQAGSNINTVQTSVTYTAPANVQYLTGTSTSAITLTANSGNDVITGNSGNDNLVAGAGNDTLIAGTGSAKTTMTGGTGNDTFVINNTADVITAKSGTNINTVQTSVTYTAPTNVQNLTGTGSAAITLTGNSGNDTLVAGTGNDILVAGTNSAKTTMIGGAGNDTFVVNNIADIVTAQAGTNVNTVQTSVTYTAPANIQNLTGTGTTAITLTGNSLNDLITGNSANDTLVAGVGNDTLVAGTGSTKTTMTGSTGNDTFVINNTADVITAKSGTNINTVQTSVTYTAPANVQILTGTSTSVITLTGNTLNDLITGNSGNDSLVAGSGNDTLTAGTGSTKTTMTGGAGNDTFNVNSTSDVVTATAGSNVNTIQTSASFTAPTNVQDLFGSGTGSITLTGNSGNDLLIGNSGNDTLTAGTGATVIEAGSGTDVMKDTGSANAMIGGAGNDSMTGGTGASFLVGGAGNDAITLGAGTAVVAFNSGAGKATIAPGTNTSNVLSLGGGIAYANLSFSKSGNNLILNTGGNNAITFTNWYSASSDQNFVTLQVIEQAASTYSSSSSNVLYNSEVEEFSFTQLVAAFNTALAANPSLTSWSLSNALLTDHLSSSNTAALGGDLAYYDGLNGNLTGMNLATADTTLQNSSFGKTAQTIDSWSGISGGANKLH